MLTDKILIPLIEEKENILDEDMSILKDEYIITKSKENPNLLYLFPKDFFIEDVYFYNIFDLSKFIGKNNNDTVYIILEETDEENISYIIGNTKYMDKKYHTKGIILKDKWKTETDILLKMLSFVLSIINPKKVIIFNITDSRLTNETSRRILEEFEKEYFIEKYGRKKFINTLKKIKVHEKLEMKIVPYIIGITLSALIFGSSVFLTNMKNKLIKKRAISQIDTYKKSILISKKKYYNLKQIYSKKLNILKQLESKKIYKGTNDEQNKHSPKTKSS